MNNNIFAKNLLKICKKAQGVVISGHINPDYDALCSCLAMQEILSQNGIKADIMLEQPLDSTFDYLSSKYKFIYEAQNYEVLITVDTAEPKLLPANVMSVKENAKFTFNIDHHQSNKMYAQNNYVQGEISSACEVIYYLFEKNFNLTQTLAQFLYLGIYTDTGGFIYSNTKENTFKCLANLIKTGFDADDLLLKCFRNKSLASFEMTKRAFNSIKFYANGAIAVSQLRYEDYEQSKANLNEAKFIVSYLPTIQNVKVGIAVSEPKTNDFHVSLRTACNDVNVSEIAKQFGGGGHIRASGLTLKGDYQKALNALIKFTKYTLEKKS